MIEFREVELDDCEFVYQVRNAPEVREYAKHSEKLSFPQHRHWFDSLLTNGLEYCWILSDEWNVKPHQQRVGYVRLTLDSVASRTGRIGLALLPSAQQLGFGTQMLVHVFREAKRLQLSTVHAEVHNRNKASIALFNKMDFVSHEVLNGFHQMWRGV